MAALQPRIQGNMEPAELMLSEMHRQQGQTSASWTQCCRNNGIMLPTNILGKLSSSHLATERSGGYVTNVQMATCTVGLLLSATEAKAQAAHSALGDCSPEDVTAFSNKLAVWQCQVCSHVWTAIISSRVRQGTACPLCHPTFADSNDRLLSEWDHTRNAALGISPDKIRLQSNKSVFWLCCNCPAGQEHSYSARADL